jgi:hypothetical protein
MLRPIISSIAFAAAGLMLAGPAVAEELKFKVVMTEVGGSTMDVEAFKGHSIGATKYAGAAMFDDGRIAYKTVVSTSEDSGETGTYTGYSTYMFQNGDVLVVQFKGGWSPDSNGGDYTVVSGEGAYKGATGTGRFDAVENPWKDADMFEGTISVKRAEPLCVSE